MPGFPKGYWRGDKTLDQVSKSERDKELDQLFDETPIVMSSHDRRKAVFGAVKLWQMARPHEVSSALRQCKRMKDARIDEQCHTGEGERILGMIPAFVNEVLVQAFNDTHYIWNNPEVIGDLFDAFEVGRMSYNKDGTGSRNRVTLNSADLK